MTAIPINAPTVEAKPTTVKAASTLTESMIGRFREQYTVAIAAAEVAATHTATEGWQAIYREHITEQRKAKGRIAETLRDMANRLEHPGWIDDDDDKIVKEAVKEAAGLRDADAAFQMQVVSKIRNAASEAKRIRDEFEFEADKAEEKNPLLYRGIGVAVRQAIGEHPQVHWNPGPGTITIGHAAPGYAFTDQGEQIDTRTGEVKYTVGVDVAKPGSADSSVEWVPPEQAAQVLNDTGKAPAPLSPTDDSAAAIGAVVGVGPDDGRDAPSETWDNRLTVSCGVASKKVGTQAAEHLRTAGYPTLNDVQGVRAVYADWRDRIKAEVDEKAGYPLTTRQLDGLEEAIQARLGQ